MAKYSVMLSKSFSTVVDVEADSIEEALASAYHNEPGDSIIGFDWEPEGASDAVVIYDQNDSEVWHRDGKES